ncbi:dockerin type I domain-containing protein [Lacipirellula sp.]|uniref:dockerin type I domain-containing protein n=1 Tax=Lacipirellula sp. TaxID=2691419 RepID=UPI003D108E0C
MLAVDFGTAGILPQTGFLEVAGNASQATASATLGGYTVNLAGQGFGTASSGHSGAIDQSVRGLYRDYYYNNSDLPGEGVSLSIGNVIPNHDYSLTLWSYDGDQFFSPTDTVWGPTGSNTSGGSSFITNFADPTPTTLADYSTTIQVSSTTSVLDVLGSTVSGSGGTRLNGFRLTDGSTDVLSVDLGVPVPPPSPVQPGFNGMSGNFPLGANSPAPSLTNTFGSYTVTVSGDPYHDTDYSRVGFEQNSGAAAIDESIRGLFGDALVNNLDLNDGSGLTLTIDGVVPNKQYAVKVWSYNADNTVYSTPTQFGPAANSSTSGTSGSVTQFATPLPASLNDYSTTIIVSSTTSTLTIHGASTANYGGTRLNGFELSEVNPAIAGDFNGDGLVSQADLTIWKAHFGTASGATTATGDADGDQDVDGNDFLVWQKDFSSPSPTVAVPEPSAFALVGVGVLLFASRRGLLSSRH